MDGYYLAYYKAITFENDVYKIDLIDNSSKISQIWIKILDKPYQVQIWKINRRDTERDSSYSYELKVPRKAINDLPILYIMNLAGLDNSMEFFDDLDLEKLYNK